METDGESVMNLCLPAKGRLSQMSSEDFASSLLGGLFLSQKHTEEIVPHFLTSPCIGHLLGHTEARPSGLGCGWEKGL